MHSDIGGPLDTAIGGGPYMLLFIDDATRHRDKYISKYKSEALEKFKEWKALGEKELGNQVKQFRKDGGGEYTCKKFAEYLKSEGILKETTTLYTPQSNGVVEWVNRNDHGMRMMHAGRCRTFEEVLGICSLSGSLSQEPHSDTHCARSDSV
jgi:hypothetical protein